LQNLPRSNARLLGQVNDLGDRLAKTLEELLAVGFPSVLNAGSMEAEVLLPTRRSYSWLIPEGMR
jgi:hypothetical protein